MSARYAIYYTPAPHTALWQLASSWLGRDAVMNTARARPPRIGLSAAEVEAATKGPARYGFHATLVAPFELSSGVTRAQLCDALATFVHDRPALTSRLEVGRIDGFLALVPETPDPRLNELAAECVQTFNRFRAPLNEADLVRRGADNLSQREHALLMRWGYPYVMEEFRFHMSLTAPLDPDPRARIEPELAELFAPVLTQPVDIDGLSLLMQADRASDFKLVERFRLAAEN